MIIKCQKKSLVFFNEKHKTLRTSIKRMNTYLKLQTRVPIAAPPKRIAYGEKLLAMGSCFAENIGNRLAHYAYSLELNPFGISYNPLSVFEALTRLQSQQGYQADELFEHRERWHSFDHHGRFSAPTAEGCLQAINAELQQAHLHLQETKVLLLTLGTAWIYRQKNNGEVVNNCHQLSANNFVRERLTVAEIVAAGRAAIGGLQAQQPDLQVWFTLSPVRHLKDGPQENQLSKAILLLAIEELVAELPQAYYFPAYELLLDELRDYRFYARDMAHPNTLAVDYIWARFEEVCLLAAEAPLRRRVERLRQAAAHRPINAQSKAHQQFVQQQIKKIEHLASEYPILDLQNLRKDLLNGNNLGAKI